MRSFAPRSLAPALALGLDPFLDDVLLERLVDWILS